MAMGKSKWSRRCPADKSGRQPSPPARLRRLGRLVFRLCLMLIAASMALTIAFRWLPVPTSSLILQRRLTALVENDKKFNYRHRWVSLKKISPHAPVAAIAAEDQKFPHHYGFDFEAIERAWEYNQRGKKMHGASTISQQLAKNLFLWPQRSFVRKGFEVYFTMLLEGLWPKRRIIEVYLNVVEFGPGIFGIEEASRAYFRKPAARLSSHEAALLAASLPSPLRSNPARPSAYLRQRAAHIQEQMRLLGGPALLKSL